MLGTCPVLFSKTHLLLNTRCYKANTFKLAVTKPTFKYRQNSLELKAELLEISIEKAKSFNVTLLHSCTVYKVLCFTIKMSINITGNFLY